MTQSYRTSTHLSPTQGSRREIAFSTCRVDFAQLLFPLRVNTMFPHPVSMKRETANSSANTIPIAVDARQMLEETHMQYVCSYCCDCDTITVSIMAVTPQNSAHTSHAS